MNTEQHIRMQINRAKTLMRIVERNREFGSAGHSMRAIDLLDNFPIEIYLLADQEFRAESGK